MINLAASVSFDDSLHDSINMNYRGSMRMLDLAKQTKNIVSYCHVSTAYVNCNQPFDTLIDEEIYDKDQDVDRLVTKYTNMSPPEIQENIKEILNGYPNTYTYTKAMTERSILKKKGTLPCCIVRPSMTGCSWKEPMRGWVDSISAMGAPIFFYGILFGYALSAKGDGSELVDVVAVDQCSNSILLATCYTAMNPSTLHVFNHTSSDINPMTLKTFCDGVNQFYKYYPHELQVLTPGVQLAKTPRQRDMLLKFYQIAPVRAMQLFNKIPVVGSAATSKKLDKVYQAMMKLK